jgi:hypothetical protein
MFMVQTLAAAGELQRDLQRELTYDGLRAAEAKGSKGGRRPAVPAGKTGPVRTAYLEGPLHRRPRPRPRRQPRRHPHRRRRPPVRAHRHRGRRLRVGAAGTLDLPGKVADFLRTAELEPADRSALDQGVPARRGQGYTLRVTAAPAVHRQLRARCQPLDGPQGAPAQRKARREYENRVSTLPPTGP